MKRSVTFLFGLITAVVATFAPATAKSQCTAAGGPASCSVAGTASITVGRVIQLQLSATSTALTAPTPADFDAGFNSTSGPTLTISANAAWTLYVRSSAPVWSATTTSPGAPARTNKPVGDLSWSTSVAGPFAPLTTTDASLASGPATANNVNTLYFQTAYSWQLDPPGDYGLTLVLSLTAP